MKKAVYAGSFDPITTGHLWMIRAGAAIFDTLVVAIGVNPDKRTTFTLDERLAFLRDATGDIPNVVIDSFGSLFLVDYARTAGACYILRGIRNESDYAYERAMRHVNSDLDQNIGTVFLMPPRAIAEVSSSMVKGLVGPAGWEQVVRQYVPPKVFDALQHRHAASGAASAGPA